MVLLCILEALGYTLAIVQVDVVIEFIDLGVIGLGGNTERGTQVTEPDTSPTREIRLKSHGFARFHRHAKPIAISDQLCFYLPPPGSLPEQSGNDQRLRQKQENAGNDISFIEFPKARLAVD